jgi:hypothetical protein
VKVWKFEVRPPGPNGRARVEVPANTRLLSVGTQGDDMVVWGVVQEPVVVTVPRTLIVVNTGAEFPFDPGARFLGTVTFETGIVWHVWTIEGAA